jgi:exopolysaccharide biosynthesis polyprenyl glycosylphosphotransferase
VVAGTKPPRDQAAQGPCRPGTNYHDAVNFRLPTRARRSDPGAALPLLTRLNSRGIRLLQPADAIVLYGLMVLINVGRFGFTWPDYPLSHYILGFAAATGIHIAVYYFGGLYERELRLGHRPRLPRIIALTTIAGLLCGVAALMTGRYLLPRANLVLLMVLGALAVATNRRMARWLRMQREGPPRVLLVGAPDEVNLARKQLRTEDMIEVSGEAASIEALVERVEETASTEVLLLSSRTLDDLYPEPLTSLEDRGIGVLQVVSPRDSLLGLRNVREIGGMPFVALYRHVMPLSQRRLKRVIDLGLCVLFSPLLLLVLGFLAAYVRVTAGPPVLYRQTRVGQDGKEFELVKFRSMYPGAEDDTGAVLASADDPRVVPALRWLRQTRLDELPQVWNVLRGEMSLVGPRPERPELTRRFAVLIPGYTRRHEVPPGMTGLAQIYGRYHTDAEYKLGHDIQYLVNWSPILDLQTLLRTAWVVITRRG